MKNSVLRRPLATVLSLLMVIGLFTICGFGTLAADTAESAVIQSWTVEQLDAAAAAKGTQNQHSKPIYEKTGTPLGRHVVTVGGNWLFHSVMIPREQYNEGDKLVIKLLVWFNNASYGNVMPIEPQWVSTEPGVKTFISDQQINQAEIKTHPVYGYRYKEVEAEYTVTAADVADGITQMQVRVMLNGDEDINCYGGSIVNQTTGKTIFDWDGVAINGLGANTNDQTTVEAIRDNDNPYLASYAGPESYTARTNEPYASYNSDGLEEGEAILMDSLGAILGEGRYAFYFNMASQFSLGEKKVTYRAKDGDKVLAEQTIMLADVEATVGADTGTFEIRDLPFTVDAESAGHEITFEIVLHNSTDYYLKGVTLEKYVDPVSYTAAQLAASAEGLGADFDKVMGGQDETEIVGLTFNGAKTVIFTDLATEATIAGQYAFQAALASSNAADATLNAYVVEDDQPVLVESAKFTANTEGAASLAQVAFNVTDSMVGKQIVFGFEQADGSAVTLSGLNFVRLGDVQDPDPVLVKEWSAKDLGDNAEAKFRYNYQTKEAAVGYRVDGYVPNDPNDPETATYLVQWTRADVMSGALEEGAIMPNDVIRYGGYFEYDQGLDAEAGCGFTIMYGPTYSDEFAGGGVNMGSDEFMALEEQIDEQYGFTYRDASKTYTIASQEEADALVASGFKILIGDFRGPHYDVSPQTVYGFYVYNETQELYLFQKTGAELLSMGWTKNGDYTNLVTVEYADTSAITGITFQAAESDQSLLKAPLSTQVESAGAYSLSLNDLAVSGEGAVTVDVGVLVDDVLVPLVSKTVANDDAAISFPVTAAMAANPVAFAIRQEAGVTTSLSGVSLSYVRKLDASEDNADVAAAFDVATAIAKLPANITLADQDAVDAAATAFNSLTDAQKALVANAGVLEAAIDTIEELEAGKEAADAVIAKVAALPQVEALTLDDEAAVNEAKAAYDELSDLVKTLVDEATVTKLDAAVTRIAELKADQEAADAVIEKINALPETITQEHKTDVEEARSAYDALTDAQKALVSEDIVAKLEAAEKALAITYGDVNGDGKINAEDALLCLQHSVKLTTLEGDQFTAADVDESGKIDASDALYILQYSVKLVTELPIK